MRYPLSRRRAFLDIEGLQFFAEALAFGLFGKIAGLRFEGVGRAELFDASVAEDEDLIAFAEGGVAVADDDAGALPHEGEDALKDEGFGGGIDGGEAVVEDHEFGGTEEGAGDGAALALAAGEGNPSFADAGEESIGKFVKIGFEGGKAEDFVEFFGGGIGFGEAEVFFEGHGEENRFLGGDA